MQADSVNLRSVVRWLTETKGLAIQDEWLQACVEWIVSEEAVDSEEVLRELVYEQWLHADLRDVVSQGCIPESVARQQKGQVRGRFIVQLQSVVDVSKPVYGQLQKLKGKSLDEADTPEKKYPEPKANRLLLLELTDGVSDLQAMEYQSVTQLNQQQLLPGTKLVIQGELQYRLGVLLLCEGQVEVLGGKVEHLMETNAPRKVLARLLNNESLAGSEPGVGQGGVTSVAGQTATSAPAAAGSNEATATTTLPQPFHSSADLGRRHSEDVDSRRRRSGVAVTGHTAPPITPSTTVSVGEGAPQRRSSALVGEEMADFVDGRVDFEDFEDFDDNGDGGGGNGGGDGGGVEEMEEVEEDINDIPGHEEWQEDDPVNYSPVEQYGAEEEEGKLFNIEQATASSSIMTHEPSHLETSDSHSHTRMESVIAPKSKLSLRQQKSAKSRVCEIDMVVGERREYERARKPPVASVKPIQQQLPQGSKEKKEKQSPSFLLTESELFEAPVVVGRVFEVENNSWKLNPFLKLKARFVRVCEMLDHTSGSWKVTVMVADSEGSQMRVQLSDKVLERLIGFSAQEFKNHIKPNKHIPKIKIRAAKGFTQCMVALDDLNCFMVMAGPPSISVNYPCVIQLLDQ